VDADNGNTDHGHQGQHPITEKEWTGEKKQEEEKQDAPLQPGAEDSYILPVIFLKGSKVEAH